MQARHTQARLQIRAITSKALVNRTRIKVVKMELTKNFRHSGMRLLAQARNDGKLRLTRRGLAERGLRRGEPGDRHAVRRAGHVVEPDLVTERHRRRIAAMLAADPDLQLRPRLAAALDADLHEFADAGLIDRYERVDLQDAAL